MADIATLQLKIDSTQAKTAQGDLENLSESGEKTEKSIVSMGTAIGIGLTAAAAATVMFVRSGIEAADAMNDLHLKTGLAFDELAAYDLLARQSGTSIDGMADSFKFLGKYMTEHSDKLASIGVTSKDQSVAMSQFADVIAGIEDPALRTSLAMEVLGRSGNDLLPALVGGSAAFEDAKKNSKGYGEALEKTAGNADEFNDLLAVGETKIKQFKTEVAGSLLPLLIEIAKGFTSASVASASMEAAFNPLTETLRAVTILGGNVAFVFKTIGTELGGMAAQIAAFASGDFAGFSAIGDAMKKDAAESRKSFDEWEKNVLNAGKLAKSEVLSAADATKKLSDEQEKAARKLVAPDKKEKEIKEIKEKIDLNEQTISQLRREADIYGFTAGQIRIYDAEKANANETQLKEITTLAQAMDARKAATKQAEMDAKRLADENKKAAEKSERAWQNFSDNVQNVFANSLYNGMMGTFDGIEDMFKQMILRMVAEAAAAEMMISMRAAGKGLLGMFAGGGQGNPSGGADSMGFATTSGGETLSFAGGGFTGGGARSGGVDGMGGFPAILHPNETVVDHTKGGSSGGTVINDNTTINIDSRSDRMQVMKDVQKMIIAGQARLVDNLQRKGQLA